MSPRKTIVLDAHLLVLLTVGLTDVAYIARHKRLYPTYREQHFELLLEMVERAPSVAATTHGLTEASNLLRQCADPVRSEVMETLAALIRSSGELTPDAERASAMPEFVRLGLTDAAFTLLDPEIYRVLSADLDLIVALQTRGFEALNFQTMIFD